jgi:hypothetical protein
MVPEAPEDGPEPALPAGVELGELEAIVRRIVAEELRPLREAIARLEVMAPSSPPVGGSPTSLMRERMRQHRADEVPDGTDWAEVFQPEEALLAYPPSTIIPTYNISSRR